mgnify:CR=1 FL=1
MLKLLKNAQVYAPQPIGRQDVLIAGEKILRIAPRIEGYDHLPDVEIYDINGAILAPGLIDLHVHVTGGGGEQGPVSRVPEIKLSELVESGITTVLGLLGTDGISRSIENLLYKTRALQQEGITAFMLTGSYALPSATLTGDVTRDIALLNECVGVKVALSDHRSSNLSLHELIRLASDARMGGLISGKAGIVVMHMGAGPKRLGLVRQALEESDIPIKTFLPTHCGRNDALIDEAIDFARLGGVFDITGDIDPTPEHSCGRILRRAMDAGIPSGHVTISSDGCGSLPRFDEKGECVGLTYSTPGVLMVELRHAVCREGLPLELVLEALTSTPAKVLAQTGRKGCIAPGADADLMVLDDDLQVSGLLARGTLARWQGKTLLRGTFEA